MKITKIYIEKFRGFHDQEFKPGSLLTAIAGQNGTQKSTLLGLITQPFTISVDNPMRGEKPLCGGSYRSAFSDKFRLSPTFDKPKEHDWTLFFDDNSSIEMESIQRTGDDNIRFYTKGNHQAGEGYRQLSTIFLSLKRLMPLAEEDAKKIKTDNSILSPDEVDFFDKQHNKILIEDVPITGTTAISSLNKQSMGVNTAIYDWNQNSMGQDNLSKILLAILSFKRLKDKYREHYQGGILAIDELDATMYPASQVMLLKTLKKYASKLNLQIFFTTHSTSMLKSLEELKSETEAKPETRNQIKLIFLQHSDNKVLIKNDVDYKGIYLNLNVSVDNPRQHKNKITVYREDKETETFAKAILKRKANSLSFVDVPMSCSLLMTMIEKKVPAFSYPYCIIILDGDVRNSRAYMRKISKAKNVIVLPGDESPERLIATYLHGLSDENPLWGSIVNGYTKQVCFRDIQYDEIMNGAEIGRQAAKEWFNSQLNLWGRNGVKVLNPWIETNKTDIEKFLGQFDDMVSRYIHD